MPAWAVAPPGIFIRRLYSPGASWVLNGVQEQRPGSGSGLPSPPEAETVCRQTPETIAIFLHMVLVYFTVGAKRHFGGLTP